MLAKIKGILKLPFVAIKDVVLMFVIYLPGTTGKLIRRLYYRKRLKFMGQNVRIEPGVFFQHPELISIGDDCLIDRGNILLAGKPIAGKHRRLIRGKNRDCEGEIILGNGVKIAPYCTISGMGGLNIGSNTGIGSKTSIYTYTHISIKPYILYSNTLVILENVVVGTNSTLIGVSKINSGEIIKPNSFVYEIFFKKNKRQL